MNQLTQARAALALALLIGALFLVYPLGVGADYPNHLARAYINANLAATPALQQFYSLSYSFVPNATIELIVPRLAPVFGIYGAGAMIVALAAILAPLAGVLISRILNGPDGGWLALLGFATVFNRSLESGFVNFLFGLGFALFGFAIWIGMAPGWRRTLAMAPFAAFVAVNHILGFLFLGYIALLWEGAKFAYGERGRLGPFIAILTIRDGLAFLPGVALITYAFVIADDVSTYQGTMHIFTQRLVAITSGVGFYATPASVLNGALFVMIVPLGLYFGLRKGVVRIHREMAVVCIGVAVLVAFMPSHLAGIWGLHLRYGGALLILLAASLKFTGAGRAPAAGVAFGLFAVLLLYNGVTSLHRANAAHQEIRGALAGLEKGAKLLPSVSPEVGFEIGVHAVSLGVIEAHAYAPNLFTNISAVSVKPEFRPLHFPQGKPLLPETLAAHADTDLPPAENGRWSRTFFHGWPDHFTHVLYVRMPGDPEPAIPYARKVSAGRSFVLYETDPGAQPPGSSP